MTLKEILELAIQRKATDVHLVVNKPPIVRVDGELYPVEAPNFEPIALKKLLMDSMTVKQQETLQNDMELDFSYYGHQDYHFRVNVHFEKGNIAANVRIIPTRVKTLKELGVPPQLKSLVRKKNGLIVITGPAGSGKTTTMSALVDIINSERRSKVITIEDPIEYIHHSKKSLIVQREVGSDTQSFNKALKYALRQDPDVVVIGEMRDLESITMALTTAETGHLVLTTLHAPNTVEALHRIIDVVPSGKQDQARVQLAEALIGIIGQNLIKGIEEGQRVLATEVLLATMSVRNIIRRGALVELRGQLDSEQDNGMQTFETSLSQLVRQGLISRDSAVEHAKHPSMLKI